MVMISRSPSAEPNPNLVEQKAREGEGNRAWLARLGDKDGVKLDENGVILVGGSSLADFRIRVAQSSARSDMLPSFWSSCGILLGGGVFVSVPLDLRTREAQASPADDVSAIPGCNGVRTCSLDEIDDPRRFPNVAVLRFARTHPQVRDHIERLKTDRGIIDLPSLMLPWLGFVWGTGGATNPLVGGLGLPSAAFVETVFAMAGLELTPGLSSASSCPEAIWQSAKWWTDFYEQTAADEAGAAKAQSGAAKAEHEHSDATHMPPEGYSVIRQNAAAIIE